MDEAQNLAELATELTIAWLSNPNTRVDGDAVPEFLIKAHAALLRLSARTDPAEAAPPADQPEYRPATSVRKSLASSDRIISMIDGKPYASLRRHLTAHGLSPDQYRARYSLKPDYPMVAPAHSEARREMAKKIGLGRKRKETVPAEPARPTRRKRAPAKE